MKQKLTTIFLCAFCVCLLTGCLCEHKWNDDSHTPWNNILKVDPLLLAEEYENRYKESCNEYDYEAIARDPHRYIGELGCVYGKVIQVIENNSSYTLRVAMNGSPSSVILVSYEKKAGESRILEDDYVKMYGMWCDTYTYESAMGASITVPLYFCEYLDIQ